MKRCLNGALLFFALSVFSVITGCARTVERGSVQEGPASQAPSAAGSEKEDEFFAQPVPLEQIPKDTLSEIRRRGELRVAIPLSTGGVMRDKDGKLIGFEIDLLRRLADDLGVSVSFYPVPWSKLIEPLLDGRVDLVAGGMWVTPEHALLVNFSTPYRSGGLALILGQKFRKRAKAIQFEELSRPSVTIGYVRRAEGIASKRFPQAKHEVFEKSAELFAALREGRVDGAVTYSSQAELMSLQNPKEFYLPTLPPLTSRPQAYAVRKGNYDFVNFLNSWLLVYTQEGWIAERYNYWYKSLAWGELL